MTIALPTSTPDLFGTTLAEYAAAHHTHPQAVRNDYRQLFRATDPALLPAVTRRTNDSDGTVKFCLPAGDFSPTAPAALETESVIIPMLSFGGSRWFTLCLSSQVGCRMGCSFCETARMGLLKNLTPADIVRQRLVARQIRHESIGAAPVWERWTSDPATQPLPDGRGSVSHQQTHRYFADGIQNLVFMGMGEPLDNLDNVLHAIRIFTDPAGLDFPYTQITISTVGRIDGLQKIAALCRQETTRTGKGGWRNLRIAISLNAATDKLRNELMPINKAMPLADLHRTLLDYPLPPKGRFLIEYVMIKGINDSIADANAVIAFCRDLPCVVNLIPYNPQRFAPYETPTEPTILTFLNHLKENKIFTKRRVTHGRELMGACGQLGNPELTRKELTTQSRVAVLQQPAQT
jgi:23S rRNA (adenine2503-C2)-methyltransferase